MGGLIPNPNDIEVITKLNDRFTGAELIALRRHMSANHDDMFNPARHLHRISYRLKIYPTSGTRPRARWFIFLRDLIGGQAARSIQSAIAAAVSDWDDNTNRGCVGIRFWAVYDPDLQTPPDYQANIDKPQQPDGNGQYWVSITLRCFQEIDAANPGIPDPTDADNGEHGPPQPFGNRGSGRRRNPAKGVTKKSSAAKRSTKKGPAKKGPAKKGSNAAKRGSKRSPKK